MKMNLSMMLFFSTLISGTVITITSTSWIIMWIGLEMNLMSFIPMMNKNKSPYESEASMKYFLVQAMASMMLMTSFLMSNMMSNINQWVYLILMSSLMMKMSAAPYHIWFPSVMQGLTWMNCIILMTWQKIAPMVMMSYQMTNNMFNNSIVLLTVIAGAVGGVNQTSIRKMMAYSSITHLGWMIMAINMSNALWFMYFLVYTILNIAVIIVLQKHSIFQLAQVFSTKMSSMMKFTVFISLLSLAGMPPFLGFLPKWIIIQNMVMFNEYITILVMVMTTLVTLYFYMRIMYAAFTFNSQESYWFNENLISPYLMTSITVSALGIPLIGVMNLY